ncbi:hypothetical protein SDC9_194723 [bioreactor metagenome]|uniref:Uncharacterized protein n=1 Tax=bioreactor metagenome TaxID=1076179 RepID=A0A645IIF2_9ZZZZ
MSLSSPGCMPVSSAIFAAPSTVWAARVSALFLSIPSRTAPSAIASITGKMKAGPLPESPVTASIRDSGTWTAVPTAEKIVRAVFISSEVAFFPGEIPEAASETVAAMFGMTRTTLVPSRRALS